MKTLQIPQGGIFITKLTRRSAEKVKFIAVESGAREITRKFARTHGGHVYRAVAVSRSVSDHFGQNLGRGYIVASSPPSEFVFWRNYYGKIMELQDMSKNDRHRSRTSGSLQ